MINSRTYKITLTALMTALITVSAYIRIPLPIVPVTLQCEMVILGGLLWGRKVSLCATMLYVIMGLLGLPMFTGGGGIHYVMTPTFGYILGFILSSVFTGAEKLNPYIRAYMGLGIIYLTGIVYMYLVTNTIVAGAVLISSTITLPIDAILTYFTVKTSKKLRIS